MGLPLFSQVLRNFRLACHEQRTEFEIHDTQKACLLRASQLDLCIRSFCTDRHDHTVSNSTQAAREETLTVFNEEYSAGCAIRQKDKFVRNLRVHAHNASWEQIWRSQRVLVADLCV